MSADKDIIYYENYLNNPPGLTVSTGTVLRHVDFVPGKPCAMHRTVSLDYGVVLEGEIICELDSGETRHMKRGGTFIFSRLYSLHLMMIASSVKSKKRQRRTNIIESKDYVN